MPDERKKVGFAVVGLGAIARSAVLPAFANARHARLVALVSRDRHKARQFAKQYKAAHYAIADYPACLANPEIKAVYIATPQGEHATLTVQAARAGKHVLCEKPLAGTAEQARRMVNACEKHGVILMTAYRKYFEPATVFLKQLIERGDLGRIDTIHTGFSELFNPRTSPGWLLSKKMAGGGPLTDLGVYCINTTRWLAGEDPVEVTAEAWRHNKSRFREVEEGITFRMSFPSGLVVQGSTSYGAAISSFIFVQGSKGWASLAPAYEFERARRLTANIAGTVLEKKFAVTDEFALELDAFAAAIRKKRSVAPSGRQGLRDVIIIDAIYRAAKSKKAVKVRDGGL